jgi:hypothetical protein
MQATITPCLASSIGWIVKDSDKNAAIDRVFNEYMHDVRDLFPGGIPPFLPSSGLRALNWAVSIGSGSGIVARVAPGSGSLLPAWGRQAG